MAGILMEKKPRVKQLLTTGDMGVMIGFKSREVCKWIDEGVLPSVQKPLSGRERLVHRDVFRAFCAEYGYTWAIRRLDEEEGITTPTTEPEAPSKPPKRKK